jgi:tRNA pseudouridine55 synthase
MVMEKSGILIVDKPVGMTSAKVVAWVKKNADCRKVGHTGTLDPFATGVLICCINQATKLARFFLHGSKKYQGALMLGIETDTFDATGDVTATCHVTGLSAEKINSVFCRFEGEMDQLPPVYSALKHNGIPLYRLAREGRPVQKPSRRVHISSLRVLKIDLPLVHFEVSCSAGTYIRTLCSDIGKELGCGGHLKNLRRIESCGFSEDQAITMEEMEKLLKEGRLSEKLICMSDALEDMKGYIADQELMDKVLYGQPLTGKVLERTKIHSRKKDRYGKFIRIVDPENNLLAVMGIEKNSDVYDYCCVFHPSAS